MSKLDVKPYTEFVLPTNVITRVDISKLVADAERLDSELTSKAVRKKVGANDTASLTMSNQLSEFLRLNSLNFEDSKGRTSLIKQLRILKDKAPITHMTFAAEADPESLQRLTLWLRQSVHPQAVIQVGLQPALIAGVYVRTPNHVHDFSLRGKLQGQRGLLAKELGALRVSK